MNKEKMWLYYLLEFDFVIKDEKWYQNIRDWIYSDKKDFDESYVYKRLMDIKPLSDKSEVLTFSQWHRDWKLNQILA